MLLRCDVVCGGGVREGTVLLAQLSTGFQSLPPLPTSKLDPSGADSQVGGFVYILGPMGFSNELSWEAGSFSCHLNPHRFFQSEVLRLYFTVLEPWVVWSCYRTDWWGVVMNDIPLPNGPTFVLQGSPTLY